MKNIFNDNRIIAEYMGWTQCDPLYNNKFIEPAGMRDVYSTSEMLFATDWNWLMPVVAKLQNEVQFTFCPRAGNIVLTFGMVVGKILKQDGINVIFNGVNHEEEFSNCCGVTSPNTDIDICPDCLEHCEFH
jgi:hypothetical protein